MNLWSSSYGCRSPLSPSLDVGVIGNRQWNYTGYLETYEEVTNFSEAINEYLLENHSLEEEKIVR